MNIELGYEVTTEELVRSYRRALADAKRGIAAIRATSDRTRAEREYLIAGGILTNDMMFLFMFRSPQLEQERTELFEDLLEAYREFNKKQKENEKGVD